MIIIDTSILIDHTRQANLNKSTLFRKVSSLEGIRNLGISIITVQELYQGRGTREKRGEEEVLDLLSYLKILPYDEDVAITAGKLIRDWKPEMSFADAAIAATAVNEECCLFTLNTGDFKNIPDLKLYFLR